MATWRFRRAVRTAVAAGTAAAALAGATAGAVASAATKTVLTVEVYNNWGFVQTAANAFMKAHPGVQIKISAVPGEQYFSTLPRVMESGSGPDVTVLEVVLGPYQALVQEGALANLNSIWKQDNLVAATPSSVTKNYTSSNGDRYAVNVDETILPVVYYNETVWQKLGLKAPVGHRLSLKDFNQDASALASKSYVPMSFGWTANAHHIFQQYLLSSCGDSTYYALANSWKTGGAKANWTQSCVVNAITAEQALVKNGTFGKDPLVNDDIAGADFLAQKSAMYLSGMWEVPTLQTTAKFKWGWFLMPSPPGGQPTKWLLYSADGLGVNAHLPSNVKSLAIKFVSSMMTKSFQSKLLALGRPPGRTDVVVPKSANGPLAQMVESEKTLGTAVHFVGILAPTAFQNTIENASEQVVLGSLSPAGMAKELQQTATQLRTSGSQG